jgi:hypothetical protein
MYIAYRNKYSSPIWLAVGYYLPNCSDGGNWAKKGWYKLNPGQKKTVLETTNTYSTFYAEAADGRLWSSSSYVTPLPTQAFDWCWNTDSSSAFDAGMRLVTASSAGWPWTATINLT